MQQFQARQGDVWMETGTAIPADAKPVQLDARHRIILAAGEVTGHHHAITADPTVCQAYEKDGRIYLHVETVVTVQHEEHGPITLPAGDYVTYIQREYDPLGSRRVKD